MLCLQAQLLAASLSSLLSGLDVHEDVFTVGELSSLVATQLGGLAETQARRKVSYLSVVCNVCLTYMVCVHMYREIQGSGCRFICMHKRVSSYTVPQN